MIDISSHFPDKWLENGSHQFEVQLAFIATSHSTSPLWLVLVSPLSTAIYLSTFLSSLQANTANCRQSYENTVRRIMKNGISLFQTLFPNSDSSVLGGKTDGKLVGEICNINTSFSFFFFKNFKSVM